MDANQRKIGALLSYTSMGITILVSFIYTPVMLRLLGQSEFGLYSLIGSLVGYLSILDLGLGNAIIRYTARNRVIGDKASEARLNGMFFVIYSLIGLLTVILGAILYGKIETLFGATLSVTEINKAKIMTILLIFNFAVSFPLGVFTSVIQAYEQFIFAQVIGIIRSVMTPCIILPLLLWGYGSVGMVVVNTILNMSWLLINMIYCLRVLNIAVNFKGFDLGLLKEIAGYSFFIFLNVIMDKVYWSTGQFILGMVSGTVMVAVYAVAMQLNNVYIMFSISVSGVMLPKITMMVANGADKDALSQLLIKIGRVQYAIVAYILSGFIMFGRAFINLWAGSNYIDAYYIVLFIMIPITVPLIQNVGIAILQAKNMNQFRSLVYVAIAMVNVLVSIPLAKVWGGYGCALATGVSLIIGNVVIINVYYYRKIGLDIPLFWKNIIKMSRPVILSLVFGIIINSLILQDTVLLLACKIMLFSILYLFWMWVIGFNSYEKELLLSPTKRILHTIRRVCGVSCYD